MRTEETALAKALREQEHAKEGVLINRKALTEARESLARAQKYVSDCEGAVPASERRYIDATNKVKALLDAEVAGVMGKKTGPEWDAEAGARALAENGA